MIPEDRKTKTVSFILYIESAQCCKSKAFRIMFTKHITVLNVYTLFRYNIVAINLRDMIGIHGLQNFLIITFIIMNMYWRMSVQGVYGFRLIWIYCIEGHIADLVISNICPTSFWWQFF